MEEAKQTIENLTARLQDEESNCSNTENENEFVGSGSRSVSTETQGHYKNIQRKVTCYNCYKKGNFAKQCRAPKKQQTYRESNLYGGDRRSDTPQGSVFNIGVDDEIEALVADAETTWLMDSGASMHMSPNRNIFTTFREICNLTVKLGNNDELSVKGIGTVQIDK